MLKLAPRSLPRQVKESLRPMEALHTCGALLVRRKYFPLPERELLTVWFPYPTQVVEDPRPELYVCPRQRPCQKLPPPKSPIVASGSRLASPSTAPPRLTPGPRGELFPLATHKS